MFIIFHLQSCSFTKVLSKFIKPVSGEPCKRTYNMYKQKTKLQKATEIRLIEDYILYSIDI